MSKSIVDDPKLVTIFADDKKHKVSSYVESAAKAEFLRRVKYTDENGELCETTKGELVVKNMVDNLMEKATADDVLKLKKVLGEDKQVVETHFVGSDFFLGLGTAEEYDDDSGEGTTELQ